MPKKIADSGFKNWTADRLPDLTGKTYFITGGNAGIGYEAAIHLGNAGGNIIIASRSMEKGAKAVEDLKPQVKGSVELVELNLADLSSVRKAAEATRALTSKVDGLINNAGIMQTPPQKTADGFEMQLGTNHLGHFLLNGLMFDLVDKEAGRVAVVASAAHLFGHMHFDNLMMTENYSPSHAYGQSKLANMHYMFELQRKLEAAGSKITAYGCHPGYSNTALQSTGPEGFWKNLYKLTNSWVAQSPVKGALPTVLCAAGVEAVPGAYYGPTGIGGTRGPVSDAVVSERALIVEDAQKLWTISEELVGFSWDGVL